MGHTGLLPPYIELSAVGVQPIIETQGAAYKANYNLTTSIVVQNASAFNNTNAYLNFYNRDGSFVTQYNLGTIGPQRAAGIGLASISSIPSNWAGSVQITDNNGQPLVAFAANSSTVSGDAAYNFASRPTYTIIITRVAKNDNGRTTSYLVQNTSNASCSVTAYYYDTSGNEAVSARQTYNLAAYGSVGRNQGSDTLSPGWTGSVILYGGCTALVAVEREDTSTAMSADMGIGR